MSTAIWMIKNAVRPDAWRRCRTCMFWLAKPWESGDADEGNCMRGHGWTEPEHRCADWRERN